MKKLLLIFCISMSILQAMQAQTSPTQDSLVESSNPVDSVAFESEQTDTTGTMLYTTSVPPAVDSQNINSEPYPVKPMGFVIPVASMLYGATIIGHRGLYSSHSIRQDITTLFPGFHTPLDEYTQFVPLVAAYATGFIPGTKPRHTYGKRLWLFVQAQVFTSLAVMTLKYYTHQERPNGDDHFSFPSGHTTQAFMGAALFDMEYPRQMKGIKIGFYTLAGLTGALAMMNDTHWASDVVFGAGLGMLSVRLLYLSEQFKKKRKMQR